MSSPEPGIPERFVIQYVLPGGVALRPFEDGAATMRIGLGHIDSPDDGLLREMETGAEPVPWESLAVRDEATEALRRRTGLDEDLRQRILLHVARTPYYEW